MNKSMSAARTLFLIAAIGSVAVGCKKAETPVPADTTATTTVPATTSGTSATGGSSGAGMPGTATSPASGATGMTGSTGATDGTTTSTAAGATGMTDNNAPKPAVKNNSGETQSTTPNSSLPVSDGSR